jgi:hypothetical protein
MNESATISASNTGVPEAPKTTGFSPKLGEPFNNNAEAKLDKDLKATASDPEKQGEPFGEKEKTEEYKKAEYVPSGSVANQHPSGGKVVRVNEECEYEETIEECDEWGSCGVPSTGSVGEIGDDAPFTEIVREDSPVGFADEDTFDEGEDADDVDIDLDDIDSPLEGEDEFEDPEIDDIDSEEMPDDSDIETESNEIESLRQEIEELRNLVNELMGNSQDDTEDELDVDDDSEEVDFDGEDYEDEDYEDDDELDFMKESVNLPFPVKVRTDELVDVRSRYGLAKILKNMMAERGGTDNDAKAIAMIHGRLLEILQCDYELRACMKNNHLDDNDWYEIIATMESNTSKINRLVSSLSFTTDADRKLLDSRISKLQSYVSKYSEYYDQNINPDAQTEPEVEDEEMEEMPDVDQDNIGFEDDVRPTETEMDADAWANAENFDEPGDFDDMNDMDDMFDSIKPRKLHENGTKLNVFGKHPGYRKTVMSLPKTGSDKEGNVKDWNDDSVYSEEPFGSKIGSSTPYEDAINASVEAIMESLKKKR